MLVNSVLDFKFNFSEILTRCGMWHFRLLYVGVIDENQMKWASKFREDPELCDTSQDYFNCYLYEGGKQTHTPSSTLLKTGALFGPLERFSGELIWFLMVTVTAGNNWWTKQGVESESFCGKDIWRHGIHFIAGEWWSANQLIGLVENLRVRIFDMESKYTIYMENKATRINDMSTWNDNENFFPRDD